jgi:hypothetical protein
MSRGGGCVCDADAALRSWLIELLAALGTPPEALWRRANDADDPEVRQALLLALGQAPPHGLSTADRETIVAGVAAIYRSDGDAGVHAACRWLLENRLDAGKLVADAEASFPGGVHSGRNWYIGANGHTFAILQPLKFHHGLAARRDGARRRRSRAPLNSKTVWPSACMR